MLTNPVKRVPEKLRTISYTLGTNIVTLVCYLYQKMKILCIFWKFKLVVVINNLSYPTQICKIWMIISFYQLGSSKTVDVFVVVNIFQVFDYPIYFKNIISIFHLCLLDKHYLIANCFHKCSFPYSTFRVPGSMEFTRKWNSNIITLITHAQSSNSTNSVKYSVKYSLLQTLNAT